MELKAKLDLLQEVHKYYPIGCPHFNNEYSGYKRLLDIVENKINNLLNHIEDDVWASLINELESNNKFRVYNDSYLQFPNLAARIELSKTEAEVSITQTLRITLSLLTNCYTAFIEEKATFSRFNNEANVAPVKLLWYGQKSMSDNESKWLEEVKAKIKDHYPHYTFIKHDLLLNTSIYGGLPHGEDPEDLKPYYSLYSYLFDYIQSPQGFEVIS
ncbi:hypothetical protein GCM10009122_58220 [Fulvivirga kasyanovii]|uniref:Uncharacterized protein n=1 Tax=Fulvivirga kasyanovii TaxID=396812 RepID=A0ABW9RSR0_9BACT|nr:hypothetical protein [Fulvivirga kasyanovii]MTI26756.1 hypothetical protein [Fulvivirga kasyanovii]